MKRKAVKTVKMVNKKQAAAKKKKRVQLRKPLARKTEA